MGKMVRNRYVGKVAKPRDKHGATREEMTTTGSQAERQIMAENLKKLPLAKP